MGPRPRPFTLHIADEDIADLKARLARTRFPDQTPGAPWAYGTDLNYLRKLIEYWHTRFDWRAQEARLNALPQFKVALEDVDLHFLHIQARAPILRPYWFSMVGRARCSSSSNWSHVLPIQLASAAIRKMPSRSLFHRCRAMASHSGQSRSGSASPTSPTAWPA